MIDPQSLEALRDGSVEAFDAHFARAADRLLVYVRVRIGPGLAIRIDEEDILQDVFLSARAARDGFRGETYASFVSWLCAIARSRLADAGRSAGREPRSAAFTRVLSLAEDRHTGPLTAAARVDNRSTLADAIAALPQGDREVLVAHFFEGLPQADIARETGRSASDVQRAVARALVAVGRPLRAALGEGGTS